MFSLASVCLFVHLSCFLFVSVSLSSITQKVMNELQWDFMEESAGGKRNKLLNFGGDLDHHADCPIKTLAITQQVISGFWWNFQDSSTTIEGKILGLIWITMLTLQIRNLGNVGVMSCVGQGGLRALSALVYCRTIWQRLKGKIRARMLKGITIILLSCLPRTQLCYVYHIVDSLRGQERGYT